MKNDDIKDNATLRNNSRQEGKNNTNNRRTHHFDKKNIKMNTKGNSLLRKAHAPYNFIPLNEKVILSEIAEYDSFVNFVNKKGCYSGVIQYEVETLTPLFIGWQGDEFFAPGGVIKIPGSSMRGMVHNLVRIVGFGKMVFGEDIEDRILYYRSFADVCEPYRKYYLSNMQANAGYLIKSSNNYCIIPAQQQNNNKGYDEKKSVKVQKDEKVKKGPIWSNDKVVMIIEFTNNKKSQRSIGLPDLKAIRIKVLEEDIESYNSSLECSNSSSKKPFNLLEYLNDFTEQQKIRDKHLSYLAKINGAIVPCFYMQWIDKQGHERVSFGNTPYFRLTYKKSIGEHVPSVLNQPDIIDIADGIFGKKGSFASRVFFEDAEKTSSKDTRIEKKYIKTLMAPKPTTFQHYLEQPAARVINDLKHWDNDTNIRGYKMYWHKRTKCSEWENTKPNIKMDQEVSPVKPGTRFSGSIRFEQLSAVELGALLFVLDLPQDCCHKLGKGKPFGFGSVKIKTSLKICNYEERYTQLFANNDWAGAITEQNIQQYKQPFEKYVLKNINNNQDYKTLWEYDRMRELRCMMNWEIVDKQGWNQVTKYMEIEEYKNRPILQSPSEIVLSLKKK